jgi:hypothetical protein
VKATGELFNCSTASQETSTTYRTTWRRAPWWFLDLLLIVMGYVAYTAVRNALPNRGGLAFDNAAQIDGLERHLHIEPERWLNGLVAGEQWLAHACNYYYSILHFAVPIAIAIWLYRQYRPAARRLLSAWYIATALGLVGFWLFPLAPPRMTSGFVDTLVTFGTWGGWGSGSAATISNQFAAMPSLHIAWAIWCAVVVLRLARRRWVRWLGAIYPVTTLFVILGTANHYLLDALGGAVVASLGFLNADRARIPRANPQDAIMR